MLTISLFMRLIKLIVQWISHRLSYISFIILVILLISKLSYGGCISIPLEIGVKELCSKTAVHAVVVSWQRSASSCYEGRSGGSRAKDNYLMNNIAT